MLKVQDIMQDLQYAADDVSVNVDTVERLTGANTIDGTNNRQQYTAGYDNKVYGMGILGVPSSEIMIATDARHANESAGAYAQYAGDDTSSYSIASSGVPSWFTTVWTNKLITQLLQTRPFFKMTHEFQQGMFGTTNIKIPTISQTGNGVLYGAHSGGGSANNNYNWIDRETVTLQQTLTYDDLTTAQFSMAKIDFIGNLRETIADRINLDINQIGFSGYVGRRTYGLLNDPSLNASFAFPASASNPASSQWIYKTGIEIIADINSLHASIVSIAGGQANPAEADCILGVPPTVYSYLLNPSSNLVAGSIMDFINKTYPRMKVEQVQNYQGTGSPIGASTPNYCQLIYSRLGNQEVALNCFSSLYQSHGVVRELSSYNEKVSYTIAGAIVALSVGIATAYGL